MATKCYYGETDIFAGFAIFAKHNAKNDKNNGFFKIPIGTTSIVNLQPFSILKALLGGKVQRNLVFLLFFNPDKRTTSARIYHLSLVNDSISTSSIDHLLPQKLQLNSRERRYPSNSLVSLTFSEIVSKLFL